MEMGKMELLTESLQRKKSTGLGNGTKWRGRCQSLVHGIKSLGKFENFTDTNKIVGMLVIVRHEDTGCHSIGNCVNKEVVMWEIRTRNTLESREKEEQRGQGLNLGPHSQSREIKSIQGPLEEET